MRKLQIALSLLGAAAFIGSGCSSDGPVDELPVASLQSVSIDPAQPMVEVGETVELALKGLYSDDTERSLTTNVTWTSVDPSVAKLISGSVFEGRAPGSVQITATFLDKSASATLMVTAAGLMSLELQPSFAMLEVGQTQMFTAFGKFQDGSRLDLTQVVTWSSSMPTVATVDGGEATALAAGETRITATADNGVSGSATLTVSAPRILAINLSPSQPRVALGLMVQIEAAGTFSDGPIRSVTSALTWVSSNPGVVTVSDQMGSKGLVTSVSEGQTTVTASDPLSGMQASVTVTVTAPELVSLSVAPQMSTLGAGARVFLSAQGTLTDGSILDLTRQVNWTSSDPAVAVAFDTTLERGQVLGRSAGTAMISVRDAASGLSSEDSGTSATVTVTPPTLQSISVEPGTATVVAGLTAAFSAFGNYSDGMRRNISSTVEWSTSDILRATINTSGVATGVAAGTVTVSARDPVSGISSGANGSAQLTVQPAQLVSLGVTPATAFMAIGDTRQFTATGLYSDGTNVNLSAQVSWASSNSIVTVSNTGLASSNAGGTTTISATHVPSGISSTASNQNAAVTVAPAQLLSIDVTPASVAVPLGIELQLTATGTYNNGQMIDITSVVEWTSSVTSVATVPMTGPQAGVVTAVANGTTVISARDPMSGLTSDTAGTSATMVVDATITLSSLQVTAPMNSVLVGTTSQLTAMGTFSNLAVYDLTRSVTFSSSNSAVATVSNTAGTRGQMQALAQGTTVVSAVHGPSGVNSGMNPTITVLVQSAVTIGYTGAPVSWTVPQGVSQLEIEASGAAGGNGSNGGIGGLGARIVGTVPVTPGEVLTVRVGGAGGNGTGTIGGGGGGGGSFVSRGTTQLVIAGGGGGASYQAPGTTHGQPGLTTQTGGAGGYTAVPVGTGGFTDNGGGGGTGGGGGGWSGAGTGNNWVTGGQAAGGAGGTGVYNNAGGFGGGGGSMHGGGGGGGYTGGSGGTYTVGAGGGGSFNAGVNPTVQSGVRAGNGQVILRPLP